MTTTIETTQSRAFGHATEAPDMLARALDEHWDSVCGLLTRLLGDPHEAQDLALELFARLHQRPLHDPAHLAAWLRRSATNAGLNALRARKRRERYQEQAGRESLSTSAGEDPARELERRETQRQVREVLAEMRPRKARLLLLRHGGLSYAEIAAALEVSPGSVGTLLARAERDFERRYRARFGIRQEETP